MIDLPANPHPTSAEALASDLRATIGRLKRKLREFGALGELTASQTAVLSRLDREGPASGSDLARAEGMRPQSMGAIIAALEAAGLLQGSSDPADGRRTILTLTPACRDRIAQVRAASRDWLQSAIEAQLTSEERKQLAAGLVLLNRIIGS